jgi:Tol biopolymer transport system component
MIRLRRYSIALPLLFLAAARPAADRRPITETDLFRFVWAADPQISPNGSQVVFVRVNVNEDKDRYETQIFVVPSDGSAQPRPLTSGKSDRSPRWSPSGRDIAFVRTPDPLDGKSQAAQIYLISMDGGEARALTSAATGASSPVWSPDGRTIAFNSSPKPDSSSSAQAKLDSLKKPAPDSTLKRHVSDVRVITRAQYRWNGGGYTDPASHNHIWTVPTSIGPTGALPTLRQITFGDFDEGEPVWSPDGSKLYFTSNRNFEPYYPTTGADVYAVPANGGAIARISSIDGSIGSIAL